MGGRTALERAMDAIAESTADDLAKAKSRALMTGYDARWRDIGWIAESIEEVFHLPIINPTTGKPSRSFTHAGKYDGRIRYDDRLWMLEHKTTSDDIEDPQSVYWRKLTIDAQVSGYMLASWQDGQKVEGTVYDVIRKPGIRPKKLTKAERTAILKDGQYCGFEVSDSLRNSVLDSLTHEDPTLYEYRLTRDCLDRPNHYFQRRPIPRLDQEVVEFAEELWDISKAILDARNKNLHYRNPGACVVYSTPCEYLAVCSGHDSLDSDRWQKSPVNEELPGLEHDNSVLTASRLQCFKSCRKKHLFRYELGMRRVNEDERESLMFGSLIHEALAGWWEFYRKGS